MGYPRYGFDQRFDTTAKAAAAAAAAAVAADAEPNVPEEDPLDRIRHSERALQCAVAEAERRAFAEGVAQGRKQGEAQAAVRIEAELAQALEGLDTTLDALDAGFAAAVRSVEAHGGALMAALVRRIASGLLERMAPGEMERVAADALRASGKAPLLHLRVHPALVEPLRDRLRGRNATNGFRGTLTIDGDPALARGAIEAVWEAGGLSFDPAALDAEIAALADRSIAALADMAGMPAVASDDIELDGTVSCPR